VLEKRSSERVNIKYPSIKGNQYVHATSHDNEIYKHLFPVCFCNLFCFARYRRFAAVIHQKQSPESNEGESLPIIPDLSSSPVVSPAASDENLSEALSDAHCSPTTGTASSLPAGHTFTLPTDEYMAVKSFKAKDFEYLRFMSKFQQVLPYKMKSNMEKTKCAAFNHVHFHSVSFPSFGLF
jgi:hypothetical protein